MFNNRPCDLQASGAFINKCYLDSTQLRKATRPLSYKTGQFRSLYTFTEVISTMIFENVTAFTTYNLHITSRALGEARGTDSYWWLQTPVNVLGSPQHDYSLEYDHQVQSFEEAKLLTTSFIFFRRVSSYGNKHFAQHLKQSKEFFLKTWPTHIRLQTTAGKNYQKGRAISLKLKR